MTDRDKDRDEKSATPDYLPGDEEFEEEPEEAADRLMQNKNDRPAEHDHPDKIAEAIRHL